MLPSVTPMINLSGFLGWIILNRNVCVIKKLTMQDTYINRNNAISDNKYFSPVTAYRFSITWQYYEYLYPGIFFLKLKRCAISQRQRPQLVWLWTEEHFFFSSSSCCRFVEFFLLPSFLECFELFCVYYVIRSIWARRLNPPGICNANRLLTSSATPVYVLFFASFNKI